MCTFRNQVVENKSAGIHHYLVVDGGNRVLGPIRLCNHRLHTVDGIHALHSDLLHSDLSGFVHRSYSSLPTRESTIFYVILHAISTHQRRIHCVVGLRISPSSKTHSLIETECTLDHARDANANHISNENNKAINRLKSINGTIVDEDHQPNESKQEEESVTKEHSTSYIQGLLRNPRTNARNEQRTHHVCTKIYRDPQRYPTIEPIPISMKAPPCTIVIQLMRISPAAVPNARNVAPATSSLSLHFTQRTSRLGTKKSRQTYNKETKIE